MDVEPESNGSEARAEEEGTGGSSERGYWLRQMIILLLVLVLAMGTL